MIRRSAGFSLFIGNINDDNVNASSNDRMNKFKASFERGIVLISSSNRDVVVLLE